MPLDVVSEHAEEDMSPYSIRQPMVDRPDLEIDRLQAPKRSLDLREILVGSHRGFSGKSRSGHRRANHVQAVKRGFLGDLLFVTVIGEAPLFDLEDEVLADLVVVDHLADAKPDLGLSPQRIPLPAGRGRDLGKLLPRSLE